MQALVPSIRRSPSAQFAETLSGKVTLCMAATVIVAIAAHISIPLPFTPVPFTLQPLAVLGVGLALGPAAGFASMLAYLVEGAMGLPVFSPVGMGGLAQLLGPTGGFLMAYPFVAAIAGALTRRPSMTGTGTTSGATRFITAFLACTVATLFLFVAGATWFHLLTHLSPRATLIASVLPFVPGELIKIALAASAYSTVKVSARI